MSLLAAGEVDILPGTYTPYGNDGNHFNLAINDGSNSTVPDSVAQALHAASDHLLVFADFVFESEPNAIDYSTGNLQFALLQNYPNPFNASTNIVYTIKKAANVSLRIYNILGQETALIFNEFKQPGQHHFLLHALEFNSGIYYYQLRADQIVETRKFVIIK